MSYDLNHVFVTNTYIISNLFQILNRTKFYHQFITARPLLQTSKICRFSSVMRYFDFWHSAIVKFSNIVLKKSLEYTPIARKKGCQHHSLKYFLLRNNSKIYLFINYNKLTVSHYITVYFKEFIIIDMFCKFV